MQRIARFVQTPGLGRAGKGPPILELRAQAAVLAETDDGPGRHDQDDKMPFRVNTALSTINSHSADEALRLFRVLRAEGDQAVEIRHRDKGELSIEEVEALAAAEPAPDEAAR